MAEQVCMAWGTPKARPTRKAKPPKYFRRKCACGCGKPIGAHNAADVRKDCRLRLKKTTAVKCACGCGAILRARKARQVFFSRQCSKQYQKQWREKAKADPATAETMRLARKQYRQKARSTPEGSMAIILSEAKARAQKRRLEFSITLADVLPLPTHCSVLGVELAYSNTGVPKPNSASVDRIDSALGYVVGNVRIISMRANILKRDGTPEELAAIGADAAKLRSRHGLKAVNG